MPTSELLNLARSVPDPLRPFGYLDLCLFTTLCLQHQKDFLHTKELATKVTIPGLSYSLLKRGTQLQPFFVEDLHEVNQNFLKLRSGHLQEISPQLTDKQHLIWQYMIPRKNFEMFYAGNHEHGDTLERIIFDFDKGDGISTENSLEAVRLFMNVVRDDNDLIQTIGNFTTMVTRTGSSFHVTIFPEKVLAKKMYTHFQCSETEKSDSFTQRRVDTIQKFCSFKISGGHEKKPGRLTVDPSLTPPGKLDRVCLGSIHLDAKKQINGFSYPVTLEMLGKKDILKFLGNLSAKEIISTLDKIELKRE